ncbi:hypothetical protein [Mycoplasma sp. SG1]|uniref:hypothetical protein n=1 Tax=Mycoplasma sp. SG1 TaxID=2810348 RepID=UPI002024ADDA|nr:hypothetical protein [Mycoplasma sp. SG1]URM53207.1 hypothetical protein JRW51_02570 [Mycoplasma sp. SG1]
MYWNIEMSNIRFHPLESLTLSNNEAIIKIEAFQFKKMKTTIKLIFNKEKFNEIKTLTDSKEFYKELSNSLLGFESKIYQDNNGESEIIILPDITIKKYN